ncbi:DEAD/DEAH box helicase family protein [Williamsia muralis]|uniref:helicase-related protein n=1 Tax=Williamsia marianensis TaxID=85044 RepID=UPI003F17EAAD
MSYSDFLDRKVKLAIAPGPDIAVCELHPSLHEWQARIVQWSLRVGRAAIWADTGLGKTMMQLEWAWQLSKQANMPALIVAPLAVCAQTVREGAKVGITRNAIQYVRTDDAVVPDDSIIYVTNYEMVEHFDPDLFCAVVLDESSILKQSDGKTRTLLIDHFNSVPFRLACSATPAPNDPEELTNQAEFLGRMTRTHMLAAYFIHDNDGWRLKGHAKQPMMQWMAQWAIALTRPSDMGGDDTGYILPGLQIIPELIPVEVDSPDQLFATELGGVSGRAQVRRQTLTQRVERASALVTADPGPWILWCGLNAEADALTAALPGAVNVHGALPADEKARMLMAFADREFDILITKPQIASQGLNYQHCHRMAFVGLGDSYEQYYQAIRRCYRYGQTEVVRAHVVLSELESQIASNVARKERQASDITTALVAEMQRARQEVAAA